MTSFPSHIQIIEVGPRDGLQNQPKHISTQKKIEFIDALSKTGLKTIEASAFVHPEWIPQLSDANEVFAKIQRVQGVKYIALVPNERGCSRALASGVDEISVLTAASESFCQRNTNTSLEGAIQRLKPIAEQAISSGVSIRGYISCVIECPYEGPTDLKIVRSITEQLLDIGISTISLSDTLGVAKPEDIQRLYASLDGILTPEESVLHLHDTKGTALACAAEAMKCGVVQFDTSCGGLGGCPYAPGAAGNLATEDLVSFAHENGIKTDIDFQLLAAASRVIEQELDCNLRSSAYRTFQDEQTLPSE